MGYVCRNPSLANTCQRADTRNSGLWVHRSWLISQVWFPALKTQILVCKLLLRPEHTQWGPELNLKASYLKHPEVLTNISLNFLMLHKLIFTIDKYVISRTKAVFWSRNGKCTQRTICGIILSLSVYSGSISPKLAANIWMHREEIFFCYYDPWSTAFNTIKTK